MGPDAVHGRCIGVHRRPGATSAPAGYRPPRWSRSGGGSAGATSFAALSRLSVQPAASSAAFAAGLAPPPSHSSSGAPPAASLAAAVMPLADRATPSVHAT